MPGGSHQIRQLGEDFEVELVKLRGTFCLQHKDELVKLYCFQCKVNMCWICSAVNHRNHECKEISVVAEERKQQLVCITGKVAAKANEVQNKQKQLDVEKVKFLSKLNDTANLIKQCGEEAKKLIDAHVLQLLDKLSADKGRELKAIEDRKDSYDMTKIALDSFQTYVLELKAKGSPSDILATYNGVEVRANELLQTNIEDHHINCVTFTPATSKDVAVLVGNLKYPSVVAQSVNAAQSRRQGTIAAEGIYRPAQYFAGHTYQ
jgi:vacuolar-type H+-ATPase subunit I/STV1